MAFCGCEAARPKGAKLHRVSLMALKPRKSPVPVVNVELRENIEFACPLSIPQSGAQCTSRVGRRRVGGFQIPSCT
jgi:hypothetical protein